MKYLITLTLIFSISTLGHSQESEYKDFDFWVGEWNVYKYGTDTLVGKSRITSILNGKAIQEFYQSTTSPYEGTSLNKYNPRIKKWEQFWVDNSGLSLHIVGGLKDKKMVMENESNRISWEKIKGQRVRQIWETSTDKGKSWKKVFDGEYQKQ